MVRLAKPMAEASTGVHHGESQMGMHAGNMYSLAASRYRTVLKVILEMVQNGLDSQANEFWVVVNLQNRHIICRDNGVGVSKQNFEKSLSKIGQTIKRSDQLGRFGIGVISPLGKCSHFTFTSCASVSKDYLEWQFNTKEIFTNDQPPKLNVRKMNYVFGTGQSQVRWRTEVWIHNLLKDREISNVTLSGLKAAILDRFAPKMRRLDAKLHIRVVTEGGLYEEDVIKAKAYTGVRLPDFRSISEDAGTCVAELYLLNKHNAGRTKGRVVIGEIGNEFRVPFSDFMKTASEFVSDDVQLAVESGLFEGEFLSSGITLLTEREGFEHNDALKSFCTFLQDWYEQSGSNYLDGEREDKAAERLQMLGVEAMQQVETLLRNPNFSSLSSAIKNRRLGTSGQGDTISGDGVDVPSAEMPGGSGSGGGGSSGGGHQNGPSSGKGKITTGVVGPRGSKKTTVDSPTLKLQIVHEAMEHDDELWKFDQSTGVIKFNIRHDVWVKCDAKNSALVKLQTFVVLQVLSLYSQPDANWLDPQRCIMDTLTDPMAQLFLDWDSGKTKSKKKVE